MNRGVRHYANVAKSSAIESASPHQLIAMLFEGALTRLATARGCMERKDFAGKGEQLGRAISIVGGLQSFLDMEKGGDLAKNLDALYDYITRILFDASIKNDIGKVDEAVSLIRTIKEGWDGIADQVNTPASQQEGFRSGSTV